MLKEKLMKKLSKKPDLHPLEKDAKMGIIKELGRQASSMMGEKLHPAMKAEVSSDSKEGLKKGLAKAAGLVDHEADPDKIVEDAEEELHSDLDHDGEKGESPEHIAKVLGEGSPEEEASESPHEEQAELEAEHADKSPEELDAHIQKLTALKHKKLAGHA